MARVVAITAHPDDETIFGGGMLAKYALEGHEVIIVATTRGEGGEMGDPPLGPKYRLGEIREQELRCAGAALGVREVIFLDFIDPSIEIGEPPMAVDAPFDEFSAALSDCLRRTTPDVVITHGSRGEYGHPQHVYTHQVVLAAVRELDRQPELLTWMANPGHTTPFDRLINVDDVADIVLDVTPWLEQKAAALECHRTQHAMIRRNTGCSNIRDVIPRIEPYKRWRIT